MIVITVNTAEKLINVMSRARVFNAWDESRHPRDKDGKFSSDDNKGYSIDIDENKIASKSLPIQELRKKAKEYYYKYLAGTSVKRSDLGEIYFSHKGYKKPISFSADERKLRLFPYLPEIIEKGELVSEEQERYGRTNVSAFYVIKSKIIILGKEETVRVTIRKDNMGKLYYDHVINKAFGKTPSENKSGGSSGLNNSLAKCVYTVNLFFEPQKY